MKHARQARDPVCGMMVDVDSKAIQASYEGVDYYFCASACLAAFESDPAQFAPVPVPSEPHTKWAGVVAPKFGSAGSGGAEYEPPPR